MSTDVVRIYVHVYTIYHISTDVVRIYVHVYNIYQMSTDVVRIYVHVYTVCHISTDVVRIYGHVYIIYQISTDVHAMILILCTMQRHWGALTNILQHISLSRTKATTTWLYHYLDISMAIMGMYVLVARMKGLPLLCGVTPAAALYHVYRLRDSKLQNVILFSKCVCYHVGQLYVFNRSWEPQTAFPII